MSNLDKHLKQEGLERQLIALTIELEKYNEHSADGFISEEYGYVADPYSHPEDGRFPINPALYYGAEYAEWFYGITEKTIEDAKQHLARVEANFVNTLVHDLITRELASIEDVINRIKADHNLEGNFEVVATVVRKD